MKKYLCWSMVLVLLLALSAGCSNGNNANDNETAPNESAVNNQEEALPENFHAEGFPIVDNPVTLKLMGMKYPIQGAWEDLQFFNVLSEKTNIKFEFDTPASQNYAEKKNLAFATNSLPDIFFGGSLTPMDEVEYGNQGVLVPLEGLIEKYAPNIQKLFEEMPDVKKTITAPDGHIYALPKISTIPRGLALKAWINQSWLEKLNMTDIPADTEAFYELLKQFKEGDPNGNGEADEIPFSVQNPSMLTTIILPAFGLVEDGNKIGVFNDKAEYVPLDPKYKDYLTYVRRLYEEKLLDNEIFSHTQQQYTAKGKENKTGVFVAAGPFIHVDITPLESVGYPYLPPMTSPVNDHKIYPVSTGIARGAFAITKENKNPEASIRLADYLYSEEGAKLVMMGESWEWNADKTSWSFVSPIDNREEYRGGKITPDAGGTILPYWTWSKEAMAFAAKENNPQGNYFNQVTNDAYLPYGVTPFPMTYFSEEEQARLNVLLTDLNTYVDQMNAKFITGNIGMDQWDEFTSTLKKMGAEEVQQIHQVAYDRWNQG
ncbi:extracellular solute-binding protein [Paenibacillus sp. HB172176]|uniref:extracellular solute-binding protein n=1 Tax=Paenibacillus sp. HB172176 TaxID=2493690 RepID=UPI00143AF79E|nr:extracellular solute-binding protein [Paenibacillus sp. HB172176]